MKTTMYELLGMVKDGKAPKKIMFLGNTYRYDEIDKTYRNIIGNTNIGEMHNLEFYLDDEVEIIEEDKKIPEKINKSYNIRILDLDKSCIIKDYDMEQLIEMVQDIYDTQDDIIDYLKSKGNE